MKNEELINEIIQYPRATILMGDLKVGGVVGTARSLDGKTAYPSIFLMELEGGVPDDEEVDYSKSKYCLAGIHFKTRKSLATFRLWLDHCEERFFEIEKEI